MHIYVFSLKNARGTEVRITNYGAIIMSINIPCPDGTFNDIVLGFDEPAHYLKPEYVSSLPYFGAAIGRYANRIANAKFTLEGREFLLEKNDGEYHLHGGKNGFHSRTWKPVSFTEGNNPSLILNYLSKDGEEGYPGNLDVTISFTLTETDELIYQYKATTDQSTPVNLTHHSYFNLDKKKQGVGSHILQINADNVLEQHGYTVSGKYQPVANTPFNFTKPKRIDGSWDPAEGYDHCFVLNRKDTKEMVHAATAFSSGSGLTLEVLTTEPALQFYTGKWIPHVEGKNGESYKAFSGFCLETQHHPNAINIPSFPNTVLHPGEEYHHMTTYRFYLSAEK